MITVAGAGPGNPKYLTVDVLERIMDSEVVLAFGRIAESLMELREDMISVTKITEVLKVLESNKDKNILLLASGDPNFYGIVNYLKIKGVIVDEVLPGLSSFQYMMSKLQLSWQDARLLSLHGREGEMEAVKEQIISVILTDKDNTPSFISKELKNIGVNGKLFAGYNLSYDTEVIEEIRIGEDIEDISSLAVVVIINEMG